MLIGKTRRFILAAPYFSKIFWGNMPPDPPRENML